MLDFVPRSVNLWMHLGMYLSYEVFVALLFWYWVFVTVGIPKRKWIKAAYLLPSIILACVTIYFMPQIEFLPGKYSNYSMGIAVYVCFITVAVYCALTVGVIILKSRYIPKRKLQGLATTVVFIIIIMSLQIIFPEA